MPKLTDDERRRVREWLLDSSRLRLDRFKVYPLGKPSEQDIEDVIAVLEWPEHTHWRSCLEQGASVVWGELAARRLRTI